ncbi:MAG: EamA family transporter [Lachnospiraceae bacterium]
MKAKVKLAVAMSVFGTIGLFVKNIPLPTGEIALFRALIAIVVILFYKLIKGQGLSLGAIKKELPLLGLSGVLVGFNWILLFQSYRYTTVSLATLSYYFAPMIVMIVCPILFKERFTLRQLVCFSMATIGLVLIVGTGGAKVDQSTLIGIGYGLGAAVLYAMVILLNKYIKQVTGIDRTLVQFLAGAFVMLPYVLLTTGMQIGTIQIKGLWNLLILGVVHTGIGYCLYFTAIQELKGQEVALLSYMDPLVAIFISVLVLHESMSRIQILGGALILAFTLLHEVQITPKEIKEK